MSTLTILTILTTVCLDEQHVTPNPALERTATLSLVRLRLTVRGVAAVGDNPPTTTTPSTGASIPWGAQQGGVISPANTGNSGNNHNLNTCTYV